MPAKKKGKAKKGGGNGNGNGNAAADVDLTLQGTAVQVNKTVVEEAPEEHREWPPKTLFEFVTLEEETGKKYPVRGHDTQYVQYEQYRSFEQMQDIIDMMSADLSEPYPIFTYRYFIESWPDLCWLALLKDSADPSVSKMVGAITCKASEQAKYPSRIRGYVAMLAVHQDFRSNGFGSKLVMLAVDTMKKKGCTEVVLETEIGNSGALMLYEGLGFVRDKRLDKYYQHGTDAYRLKLWLVQP